MALMFTTVTAMSSALPVYASSLSGSTVPWTGQGTTKDGYLETIQCTGDTAAAGTLLWIFTATGADSATITINGQTYDMYQQNGQNGSFRYVQTGFNGDLNSLTASATYAGTATGNPQLTISHGCPGTAVTPAVPTFNDVCGKDNDTYTIPSTPHVNYTRNSSILTAGSHSTYGEDSVTIVAYAETGYVLNGLTSWTYDYTNEPCTKTVEPTGVTFIDLCGVQNDVYVIPTTEGDDYQVGGVTQTPGSHSATGSVTITAVAQTGYTLTGTTSWSNTFTDNECTTSVPTQAPIVKDDECGTDNDTFSVPTVTGVIYKVGGTTVSGVNSTNGALSVTVNAYPASSAYTLTGDTSWTLHFTNTDCNPCPCNDHTVSADKPDFHDVCGLRHDSYTIPSTDHVNYYVNGSPLPVAAGTYYIHAAGTVTVTAEAEQGYTLTGKDTWSFDFTNKPCKVTPKPPTFNDVCGVDNDTYTIPHTKHVVYKVNGQVVKAGTYQASGTVTITAEAKPGFKLRKHSASTWMQVFTNEDCGGNGGNQTTTPSAVTFNDVCATVNDTYTIPSTTGVVYKVNGQVVAAGSHTATGTVTVTAEALMGYTLTGTTTWTHTFTNEACAPSGGGGGFVLGETTTVTPAGKGAVLANTGESSTISTLVAVFLLVTTLLVYAYSPKYES
jgi:hypothetical protein